jgi:cephalosporin-C deacetylase-like acetyl esterase
MRKLIFKDLQVPSAGFFKFLMILIYPALLIPHGVQAQNEYDVINSWLHYKNAPNALYDHLAEQAYNHLDKRASTVAKIQTLGDWQKRQKWLNETLSDIVGPFPAKTPLNAKITRTVDKEGYQVEHIIFESQPGFYVTSSMFIPDGLKGKAPVVIYTSGHTSEGYRSKTYQHVILNLVKKNFIVFAFDPVGQGERLEYYDAEAEKSSAGGPTSEHSYPGAQAFITGSSQARYMIWDGIRAVDYLLTREEVDAERIGITGRSGGGTQSSYIAALDERIKAAAPENYITNFTRLLQSIGPQDAEQNFFNGIERGIDHADLLAVRAPKPTLMITTTLDMFSIQGARETAKEVSGIYKAYGKENNFDMVEDDAPHASTEKNREAMYAFFQRHLDNPGDPEDQEVEVLPAEEIRVTETGQVSTSLGGETVFSLNRKDAEKLVDELESSRRKIKRHISGALKAAKELSGYEEPAVVEEPVFTGRIQAEGYVVEKYFVKGEGDYVIPYLLMVPEKSNSKGIIYLHPLGKSAEASTGGEIEQLVSKGFTVLVPDMIGQGEMGQGDFHGDAYIGGISHNIWYSSMLIGRSIVGIRAGDVFRLTRLLEKNPGAGEIYGVARKEMAPVLLHAAAFDPAIAQVVLIEPFSSYRSIVMNRFYNSAFIHSTVPGALKAYDLADLAASLAPRKLIMSDVTDGVGETKDVESITQDLSFIKAAYKAKKANEQLNILSRGSLEKPSDLFIDLIK